MSERGKVYVVAMGGFGGSDISGAAVTKDQVLWTHVSSNMDFLRRDLTDGFADRRASLSELFPGGYDVEVIPLGATELPAEIAHHFTREATP